MSFLDRILRLFGLQRIERGDGMPDEHTARYMQEWREAVERNTAAMNAAAAHVEAWNADVSSGQSQIVEALAVPPKVFKAIDQADAELRLAALGALREVLPAHPEVEKPTQADVASAPASVSVTYTPRSGLIYCTGCSRSSDVVSIYFCATCKHPYCPACQHSDNHPC